ncbi:MAG: hypothetical protein JXR05_05660 [Flavobacteriaceae bacterium]
MKNKLIIFFVVISFISCSSKNERFDSETWITVDGLHKGHRIAMLNDLINNYLIFDMKYEEVVKLIGKPDRLDKETSNKVYLVEEKFGIIDPNGHVYLELKFNKENALEKWQIVETWFKE